MPGKQIVLCGVDTSGKSSIAGFLSAYLSSNSIDNIITRHPGATELGKSLRALLKQNKYSPNTEALLFAADNSAYINDILIPSLEKDKVVIADRNNFISSMAYQIASGCSLEELDKIHDAVSKAPLIDLLIIYEINWDTYQIRSKIRNEKIDSFENRGREYFESVSNAYKNLPESRLVKFVKKKNYILNIHKIDATRNIDVVITNTLKLINDEVGL